MSVDCKGDEDIVVVVDWVHRKFIYMLCEPIGSEPEPPPIYFLRIFFLSLQKTLKEWVYGFQSVVSKLCSIWKSNVTLRFHVAPSSR